MLFRFTSVTGAQDIIGCILCNQATKEARYYPCAGAEEYSAIDSAQGVVQHFGLHRNISVALNFCDHPTYFWPQG
jgi:hypothetical protein